MWFRDLLVILIGFFARFGGAWDPWNLTPTPPMGWANWNQLACDYNDTIIRQTADRLVSTGLRDLGYKILIIQECITKRGSRDAQGVPMPDEQKFPYGMKSLVDYIHSKGLLAGIYTDVGDRTCMSYEGSFNHEIIDAVTYAKWGIDFIEVDACFLPANHTYPELYARMRDAILHVHKTTGHKMILYMCSSAPVAFDTVHIWGPHTGNVWRTTPDLLVPGKPDWNRMLRNFRGNAKYPKSQGPGIGWQDPDMTEVGIPGFSVIEWQTHFSMWAMVAAPLWIGADLRVIPKAALEILSNKEVIAIDQDAKGLMADVVFKSGDMEAMLKPLQPREDESVAAALLLVNLGSKETSAAKLPLDLFPGFDPGLSIRAKDVVNSAIYNYNNGIPVPALKAHDSILLRISQRNSAMVDWKQSLDSMEQLS